MVAQIQRWALCLDPFTSGGAPLEEAAIRPAVHRGSGRTSPAYFRDITYRRIEQSIAAGG